MSSRPQIVVFTDLDGTLLDHENYSWTAAQPALTALADINAPIILSSSKTAAEIRVLQSDIGLAQFPAIVENGAGLASSNDIKNDTQSYQALRAALNQLTPQLRQQFHGFGDMSVQEISKQTGLSESAAKLAQTRQFSEPGIWQGNNTDAQAFIAELQNFGIHAREGGRFLTLSFGQTKADPMREIIAQYQPQFSVALGDAPNDIEMLETANYGIIVNNPHRAPLPPLKGEAQGKIIRTKAAGPEGWNTAMLALLAQLGIQKGTKTHG